MAAASTNEPVEKKGGLSRVLPILQWLPSYNRAWLRNDIIAGLSVWALMVPTSMGYAVISGVPVQYGLYAAAVGLIAFALFTTSKQVTQGPSSSTAAVLGAGVLAVATAGSDQAVAMAAAIVLVTGILFIIEFLAALAALLGVMTFGILQGVVIGVALSLIWLVAVSALPYIPELGRKPGTQAFFDLKEHPESQTYPGLAILRFDGGLFFVNADALGDRLRSVRVQSQAELNGVILSMEGVNFIDTEGADELKKIAQAGTGVGIDFHLARVKPQVMEVLQRDGVVDLIGPERIHDDIAAAVKVHLGKYPQDV